MGKFIFSMAIFNSFCMFTRGYIDVPGEWIRMGFEFIARKQKNTLENTAEMTKKKPQRWDSFWFKY